MTTTHHTAHFLTLDGLRGVAALMVVGYHLFEAIAFAAGESEQQMFNGLLAVDFFLILSGFVMGHAYDQRWSTMTMGQFARRRLIRLHPMVVAGTVVGLIVFALQDSVRWDGSAAPWHTILTATLLSLLLLPSPQAIDVRGNTELFPLDGPLWSLFFEYLMNIAYMLLLRRMRTLWLAVWVVTIGTTLTIFSLSDPQGTIGWGWSSQPHNIIGGLLRVGFDYPLGLLLARLWHNHSWWVNRKGSLFTLHILQWHWGVTVLATLLVAALCVPNLGSLNILYEIGCVALLFPLIVLCGAAIGNGERGAKTLTLLGNISYPIYAIHYPLIYAYIGWINSGHTPFGPLAWHTPVIVAAASLILAYLATRWYDKPIRQWLERNKG